MYLFMRMQNIMTEEHIYDGKIGGFGWIAGINESSAI